MWIFFWLIFFILWLSLDIYFGRKKAKTLSSERIYPKRKGEIDFFCSGPDFFRQLFSDIKEARERVYCLFYIIKGDKVCQDFFHLLKEKAESGIDVYLLMDWQGSRKVNKQHVDDLKRAGVRVDFFGKPRLPFFFFSLQQRNHRKITAIDGTIGYLGGFNVGREYINKSKNRLLSPWRDYHLRFCGGAAADLEAEFLADWNQEGRPVLQPAGTQTAANREGTEHVIYPSGNGELEKKLVDMISKVRSSIFIGTPYFIPTKPVFDQLLDALARGVRVTVLLPKQKDHPLVQEASYPFLRRLLLFPNARVQSFMEGFYHAKIVIFDDEVCDIGTANFDARSQLLNFECNCFIHSPAFIDRIRPVLEKDLSNSRPVTFEDLHHPAFVEKAKEKTAHLLRGFL
ncbi:cardiolipin synthase [Bacillus aerolatus]|uniref:Cardiolipin synthase n=1 Tax=Bacillus aerolatus TaxID=2653354 RepID=A0A6I1FML7_9BACI|nr:phospholipase D-like domain-containing protein [Bacillus aerolatus]KAB7707501.1 cardiolipin synthase [Bacillus aerolatus]